MKTAATATVFGALAATVAAHGTVPSFSIDGTEQRGYHLEDYYAIKNGQTPPETAGWYAENLDNGFIAPDAYGTSDIACHKNSKAATSSAKIAAGGKIDWQWSEWPESHIGPVLTYLAKCDGDCSSADPATLKFFKIDEAGYDVSAKKWAATKLIENSNKWTSTIPANLAPGNYVARHEIIAMHGAGSANGAQNYPQCINLEVTGSGSDAPEGVLATALYKADDAGILFNPYQEITSYEIPGPKLVGSGSGSGSPTTPTEPSTPAESSTPAPTPAPTEPATPSPAEPSTPAPAEPSAPAEGDDEGDDTCEADGEDEGDDEGDEGEDDTCEADEGEEEPEEGSETENPVEPPAATPTPATPEEDPECEDDAADRAPVAARAHARDFTTRA